MSHCDKHGITYHSTMWCAKCMSEQFTGIPNQQQPQLHDPVNHPAHYTSHPSGVECIAITRHMSFNLGNVFKYLWRADDKGTPIQDLKKALWYLQDEISKREQQEAANANIGVDVSGIKK